MVSHNALNTIGKEAKIFRPELKHQLHLGIPQYDIVIPWTEEDTMTGADTLMAVAPALMVRTK